MKTDFLDKFKRHVVVDGSIRTIYQYVFTVSGIALIFLDAKVWETGWVICFGFVLAGVGGLSGRAIALKIKPFEEPPYPPGCLDGKGKKNKNEKVNED